MQVLGEGKRVRSPGAEEAEMQCGAYCKDLDHQLGKPRQWEKFWPTVVLRRASPLSFSYDNLSSSA